jgi:hypothetical protein
MGVVGYVFGYGSLAAAGLAGLNRTPRREGFVADLEGFERGWGVAMDNTRTVPGYKCYVDRTGSRPDVCVAFLDLTRRRRVASTASASRSTRRRSPRWTTGSATTSAST